MKEPVKFGLILLIFCAISAGLLAAVNGVTAPVIAQAELEETLESYKVIFGDEADNFEKYDESKIATIQETYPNIEDVFVATKDGETVGYGINVSSNGFGGAMTNALGILLENDTIAGFRNISNSETKGFGTQIEEEDYYSTYVGKSAAGELKIETDPQAEDEVLLMSGATVSSKAVLAGDNIALKAYQEFLKNDK
ncbi:FMN-binding protein [Peptoniphilus stercorisuis]|uniref:Ion-translocating oxidoreductase complex subunit G n=1 Tax=Peptoniphilus stercorisuis TaxID=1436965 RepID=A0ABS4KC47_9FIRM|nr:FMN-binding protein [Peptoniphilus stercorisuis]MBP2024736.1 electron transport complex protein RnfG [Peptoniphilus stercorisuis]